MDSYKVVCEGSTLGEPGTVVSAGTLAAQLLDADLLVLSQIIEPTKITKTEKE